MKLDIISVLSDEDIAQVAALAREIWTEYFTPIIGRQQVEYMLTHFQSPAALKRQLSAGSEYYLAKAANELVGYIGLIPDPHLNTIMLSKFYVKRSMRGKGVGSGFLQFTEQKCVLEEISSIWLTVNKHNDDAVEWYKRRGFQITDKVKKDIGDGFYMDDFVMHKSML